MLYSSVIIDQMNTEIKPPVHPFGGHPAESFYERNAVALQWGIIGVAFIAACGIYWWRSNAAYEALALGQFTMAQEPEDYAEISADYANTRAAKWAQLREANGYLDSALKDAFTNREKADTDLEKASKLLEGLRNTSGPNELKEQVLFAYARCLEMTSDGKLEPAIEAYEDLLKKFPETHFKREARERIHALSRPESKEFYAFFSKQQPKPSEPARPNDEKTGAKKSATDDPLNPLTSGFGGGLKKAEEPGLDVPLLAPPSLLEKKDIPEEGASIPDVPKPKASKDAAPRKDDAVEENPKASDDKSKPGVEKPAEERKAAPADSKTEEKATEAPAAEEKKAEKPAEPKADEAKKP